MSLAIKFGNFLDENPTTSGFIYLDAVTLYTRDFKGQLTSHPIGKGSTISDHFILSNPVYQISGVISGADISLGRGIITDYENNRPSNTNEDITAVQVKGDNNFLSLLPNSTSSFFVDTASSVIVSSQARRQTLSDIRILLERLFNNSKVQIVKLFEYENTKIVKLIDNLVMISLSFTEDADNGYALYLSTSLEQATFSALKTTKLTDKDLKELDSTKVSTPVKDLAKENSKLGNNPTKSNLLEMSKEEREKVAADIAKAKGNDPNATAAKQLIALNKALNLGN